MKYENIYFLGIGGIGMSAIACYFLHEGRRVAGYDRTRSHLTEALEHEGAVIHYDEDVRQIPAPFLDPARTIVTTANTAIFLKTGSRSRNVRRCWATSPKENT